MSLIIDTVTIHLPLKRKSTPSGWISFNAVCCQHNGHSIDKRQRGGILINEGFSYHCFNCGFKASWQPGRRISKNSRKLLRWLNVNDDLISKCSIEALRLEQDSDYQTKSNILPTFIDKALPINSEPIYSFLDDIPEELTPVLEYLKSRNLYLDDYPWHWCSDPGFNNRIIIPFYYKDKLVGYTARLTRNGKPKYISEQQPGYVFNLDRQQNERKYVIVTEGPLDAISTDGVSLLGSEVNQAQSILINQLQKEVILLPDRDITGKKLVDQALELGWSVSFPDWGLGIKDANDALCKYGRLYTLYSIIKNKESNKLKIQLKARTWFNDN
jgi:hypothetical protein